MSTFAAFQPCFHMTCSTISSRLLTRELSSVVSSARINHPRAQFDFKSSTLSHHWQTSHPSNEQLRHAAKFFTQTAPKLLWSAPKLVSMPFDRSPEVCFLGRSNVGKSSLLNALLNKKIAHTSSKPGRTRSMNAFSMGISADPKKRLVVLDMPGYGKGGQAEWGKEVLKYLEKRRELKRSFLMLDVNHGIKESDLQLLELFRKHGVSHQIILSKVDKKLVPGSRLPSQEVLEARLLELGGIMDEVREMLEPSNMAEEDDLAVGELIACSSERSIDGKKLGIDAVRFAMLRAAGLEADTKPIVKQVAPEQIIAFEEIEKMQHHKH